MVTQDSPESAALLGGWLSNLKPGIRHLVGVLLLVSGVASAAWSISKSDWWGIVEAAAILSMGLMMLIRAYAYADLVFMWGMGIFMTRSGLEENPVFAGLGVLVLFCALMATILYIRDHRRGRI